MFAYSWGGLVLTHRCEVNYGSHAARIPEDQAGKLRPQHSCEPVAPRTLSPPNRLLFTDN